MGFDRIQLGVKIRAQGEVVGELVVVTAERAKIQRAFAADAIVGTGSVDTHLGADVPALPGAGRKSGRGRQRQRRCGGETRK